MGLINQISWISLFSTPNDNKLFDKFLNPAQNTSGWIDQNDVNAYEKANAVKFLDDLAGKLTGTGFSHLISIPSTKEYVARYADYLAKKLNVVHIHPLNKIDPSKKRGPKGRDRKQNFTCEEIFTPVEGLYIFDGIVAEGVTIENAIDVIVKSISCSKIEVVCICDYRNQLRNLKTAKGENT